MVALKRAVWVKVVKSLILERVYLCFDDKLAYLRHTVHQLLTVFGCDRPPGFPDLLCQLLLCPRRVRCHLDADDLPEILDRIDVRTLCWPADPFKVLSLPTPLTISICDRGIAVLEHPPQSLFREEHQGTWHNLTPQW